jgi:uncharacterized protein DUF1565
VAGLEAGQRIQGETRSDDGEEEKMTHAIRAALLAALLGGAPLAARAQVTITFEQPYTQLGVNTTWQAQVTVGGTTNKGVTWQVNNANAGSAGSGTISKTGLYTAPAKVPKPAFATITAVSKADPSVSATATVTLFAHVPTGHTYYVAPSGSDGADGSQNQPWQTVQHAANTVEAGDTVFVHQGVYNEVVTLTTSGSAAAGYITFLPYPGEAPVIDGTGLAVPNNQWGLVTLNNVGYVIVEGFEIRNFSTNSIKDVPIGIYVTGAGASDQLINNSVHDIVTTAATTPKKCGSDAFGITVYGTQAPDAIDGLAVSGNEVFDNHTGCSETLSLDGNVTNFAVVSNRVHDNDNIGIGAIGFEKVSSGAYDQARAGVIRGNTVYNITSFGNPDYGNQYAADGIYVDGGTNIVIEQNLIHNVDLGIELASEHQGHDSNFIVARNNVVYAGNSAGISIGGYAASKGGADHCTVVNNTLYENDSKKTGSGEFQIQFNATDNVFENNIVYAGAQGLLINDFTVSEPDPALLDYNLFFSAGPADFTWQKQHYKSFAAYATGSGNDVHSLFADPQFATGFDIASGSPARNVGAMLGGAVVGLRDFPGTKRVVNGTINIGAYEQ